MYGQVKTFLDELFDEHFDDAEHCDFYMKYGSTIVEISIDAYEEDSALVEVLAFCVQGVEPSFELMKELLRINSEIPLGGFSLVGNDVFYSHAFVGRKLLPDQIIASLNCVAATADEFDDTIVARFGGVTALESLRSFSRRTRPRESLN